jgi:hypothetical protein
VINVFTTGATSDDWLRRTGVGDADLDAVVRRSEDLRALGERAASVDLECGPSTSADDVSTRIGRALDDCRERSSGRFVVAAPAGAGRTDSPSRLDHVGPVARLLGSATSAVHPDHLRVRDAVLEWGRANPETTILLYDELPYHWAGSGLTGEDRVFHLPVDTSSKAAAVRCYESQLGALFTDEQVAALPRWLPAVESFAIAAGPD